MVSETTQNHNTSIKMANPRQTTTQVLNGQNQSTDNTRNADKAVEQKKFSFTDGKNALLLTIWKIIWQFLR